MQKIILDTNFLLIPGQFKVDIFRELDSLFGVYEIYIVEGILAELEKIQRTGNTRDKRAAALGIQLLKTKALKILKSPQGHVDDVLLQKASQGFLIATQDKELKKQLKKKIILRNKKILQVV